MWNITWRNVQYRRRQYFLAVLGTGLVFAIALLVTGVAQGFQTAAERTLRSLGGDLWVVREDSTGPFTTPRMMSADVADEVAERPGVEQADPILIWRLTVPQGGRLENVDVIGYRPGRFGRPALAEGREPRTAEEAAVDESLGVPVGGDVEVGGEPFRVVGFVDTQDLANDITPVHVTIEALQGLVLNGAPIASAVIVDGTPESLPEGTTSLTRDELRDDLLRPLRTADRSVAITRALLWFVAAVIVGAVMYMSALDRIRDFAVFKAVGARSGTLVAGLTAEAVTTCLLAAGLAVVVAYALRDLFPVPIVVPFRAYAALPVVAVSVGVVASLSGIRQAVRTDPSLAFSA
jgi:putative ABC transport system permease protein